MGFIKRQLLKVIEYSNNRHDQIIYKFPMDDRAEIMTGSQLVVRDGQVAIFQKDGRIADVFAPGKHKLLTSNLPILSTLGAWAYGFNSPFKADVFFVDTTVFTNQKWGTVNPIQMRDPEFGGMGSVQVRAFGQYSYKIVDAKLFMQTIAGSKTEFTTAMIDGYMKSIILSTLQDVLAESKMGALDLTANTSEFNEITRTSLQAHFEGMGMKLVAFIIENINFPENVQRIINDRMERANLRIDMDVYERQAKADALRDAAKNPGMAGTMFGVGVVNSLGQQAYGGANMGMGVGMGGAIAQQAQGQSDKVPCNNCKTPISPKAKFCPICGTPQSKSCPKCNAPVKANAKFCPECGNKL